jgi:casein kinase I homolog HRR25
MPRDSRHKSKFDKEIAVFKALRTLDYGPSGFPEFIMQGKTNYFYFYVMEKLGQSLKKIHSLCKNGKMDLKTVLNIGLQLIERLEVLHSVGLVRKSHKAYSKISE